MAASGERRLVAGRYALGAPLGRGGMGVVWRAEDVLLGRAVAVKEVALPDGPPGAEQAAVRDRALREARAAARLNHPSAVTLHDVVEADGRLFLVMELVEAPSLRDLVGTGGPLPPSAAARVGLDLLDALEAAHRAGIVHHDVKPGNVMVPPGGRAKLADFGIAWLQEDTQRTRTGSAFGSLPYVAPEQARGRRGGPPADLWALGATMWFAVEGAAPFDRDGPAATLGAILHDPPGRPGRAGPLGPVLLALLAKDPEARPTAPVVRRQLAPLASGAPDPTLPLRTARMPADPAAPTELLADPSAPPRPGWEARQGAAADGQGWGATGRRVPDGQGRGATGREVADGQGWGGPAAWGPAGPPPAWGAPAAPGGAEPPPAWGAAPPRRRRWGRRLLLAATLLVALLLLASALDDRERAGQQERTATPALGDRARDGQFQFVVHSSRCGVASVGQGLGRQTASGQFCLLGIEVVNAGAEGRSFEAGHQYLLDAAGRRHSVNGAATWAYDGSARLINRQLNPGQRIEGTLVYDVAEGVEPVQAELHDSPFSGGVKVDLR
jgi:hypothetical protein